MKHYHSFIQSAADLAAVHKELEGAAAAAEALLADVPLLQAQAESFVEGASDFLAARQGNKQLHSAAPPHTLAVDSEGSRW